MPSFIHNIESEFETIEQLIENWFHKHFSHITPGTPDHAVLTNAADDLTVALGGTVPDTQPAPEPEPLPAPAPEQPAETDQPA